MTSTTTPAPWAINPSGNRFDLDALSKSLRSLGGVPGPGLPTFPSEGEAVAAGERFLAAWPVAGYGSSYRVMPVATGWALSTYKASSCD